MSDAVALTPELVAVRDGCGRILKKLQGGMDPSEKPAGPFNDHEPFDIVESDVLSIKLKRLQDVVNYLESAVEELGEASDGYSAVGATTIENFSPVHVSSTALPLTPAPARG